MGARISGNAFLIGFLLSALRDIAKTFLKLSRLVTDVTHNAVDPVLYRYLSHIRIAFYLGFLFLNNMK